MKDMDGSESGRRRRAEPRVQPLLVHAHKGAGSFDAQLEPRRAFPWPGPLGTPLLSGPQCLAGTTPSLCPENSTPATGTGPAIFSGTTVGGGDDSHTCGSTRGVPDRAYLYEASSTGTYTFDTHGSAFDTDLAVLDTCDGAELGCGGNTGDRITSEVTLSLTAGQTVVIVVDGRSHYSAGRFVVNVTSP